MRKRTQLPDSSLRYILESLIPYTDANIKLSFQPGLFFADLERIDRNKRYKKTTLKKAYYKAIKQDLIEIDQNNIPRLTMKGEKELKQYKPNKLKDAKLMVVFDIPEAQRAKRRHLRLLLKELRFEQVQKSVWMSDYDSRNYLKEEIGFYKLENYVEIFESKRLNI